MGLVRALSSPSAPSHHKPTLHLPYLPAFCQHPLPMSQHNCKWDPLSLRLGCSGSISGESGPWTGGQGWASSPAGWLGYLCPCLLHAYLPKAILFSGQGLLLSMFQRTWEKGWEATGETSPHPVFLSLWSVGRKWSVRFQRDCRMTADNFGGQTHLSSHMLEKRQRQQAVGVEGKGG